MEAVNQQINQTTSQKAAAKTRGKFRLVKKTDASGFVMWIIQKRCLFFWDYVTSFFDENRARAVLERLRNGVPEETREVVG